MKKVKEMVNCEVKEAKKAVKEARESYNQAIRDWNKVMCSIDYTDYLPKEAPEELIKDILKKSPDITELKLDYEIACHYWRVRCEADSGCVAAEKAIADAREVLRSKEEVLNNLKHKA